MRFAVVAAVLFATSSSAVLADWQFTRWGMTRAEFEAASPGSVTFEAPDGPDQVAKGPYRVGLVDVTAQYAFHLGRLRSVVLSTPDQFTCESMAAALTKRYGAPVKDAGVAGLENFSWDDQPGNNAMQYVSMEKDGCFVAYGPLANDASSIL